VDRSIRDEKRVDSFRSKQTRLCLCRLSSSRRSLTAANSGTRLVAKIRPKVEEISVDGEVLNLLRVTFAMGVKKKVSVVDGLCGGRGMVWLDASGK